MNQLPLEKRIQIINLLVEGNSLRATSRITGCSINTVTKLLVDVGKACQSFHDQALHSLNTQRLQCDEIWSFVDTKKKNAPEPMKDTGAGDVWTWTALDSDSKMIVSWYVGNRDAESVNEFMQDVAWRITTRPLQITLDGLALYRGAIENYFELGDVHYGIEIKQYGAATGENQTERKYSANKCTKVERKQVIGKPQRGKISTSHVERQNLTMRMHMRRFTRLTNAFSKKLENHCYAIALHFVYYNFVKVNKTLRVPPAMKAGLIDNLWSVEDIIKLTENK